MEELVLVGDINNGSRKKQPLKRLERLKKKEERYANKDPAIERFQRPCAHCDDFLQCRNVSRDDVRFCKDAVYADNNKQNQDVRLGHLLQVNSPKRSRHRPGREQKKSHALRITYAIRNQTDELVPVCKEFFLQALGFSARRVLTIGKAIKSGQALRETRGGDRKSHKLAPSKNKAREFIKGLHAEESHYNRAKSKRLYMNSEFNIRRLWMIFKKDTEKEFHLSYGIFHRIFVREFNIGFGTPATDVCSYCARLKTQLKAAIEDKEKTAIMCEYRVHRLRAKQFTLLMREKHDDSVSFCFDMQQVQPLPKVPIQEAFYSRQISHYCLAIVNTETNKPVFYNWTENLSGRGSNEVGSALYDFLDKLVFPPGTKLLRLFADGCGGQNKNSHIIHILTVWFLQRAPASLKRIALYFPVRGHSYLPADRVFGLVEKVLRTRPVILSPEEYSEIYKEFGEVRFLGNDWDVYDLKPLLLSMKKIEGISEIKRMHFKKVKKRNQPDFTVKVQAQVNFRVDDESQIFQSLLKRGKQNRQLSLTPNKAKVVLSAEKIRDVNKLLEKYAGDWRKNQLLKWYNPIIATESSTANVSADEEHPDDCMCGEEEESLRL